MRNLHADTDDLASASPPAGGVWTFPRLPPRGPRTWRLKRNCALRPNQYFAAIGLLMGISAAVAISCWIRGLWVVPIFCCIELAAIAAAALAYARHAIDGETITLTEDRDIRVEVDRGVRHDTYLLKEQGLRLIKDDSDILCLRQGTTCIQVGRYASPAARDAFEVGLRSALTGRTDR